MKQVKEKTHARFAPSSAKIWLNCDGAVPLSLTCPPQVASPQALEGTMAHGYAERLKRVEFRSYGTNTEKLKLRKSILDEIRDEEMRGHVINYVDFVAKVREKFLAKYPDRFIEFVEEKFHYNEHNSGTIDYGVVAGRACVLIDLKYGAGVEVEAKDNPQLMNYALCVSQKYPTVKDFHLFIYQPRIGDVPHDRFDTTLIEVKKFEKQVNAAIKNSLRIIKSGVDIEDLKEGDWCQFCPAISICPRKLKAVEDTAATMFEIEDQEKGVIAAHLMMESVPVKRLVEVFSKRNEIKKFLDKLEEYLEGKLLAGDDIPGVKLVTGKGKRCWSKSLSVDEVKAGLKKLGVKKPTVEKVIGLGEAEKALKGTGKVIDDLVDAPSEYPVLALSTDKRPDWDLTKKVETLFDVIED